MKCISLWKNGARNKGDEYEFKPLSEKNIVVDDFCHSDEEVVEAVNALVEENENRINSIDSLGMLVLNQQSIIKHLVSRIETLEKIISGM